MGALDSISVDGAAVIFSVAGQSFTVSPDEAAAFALHDYVVAAASGDGPAVVYHVGAPYSPGVSAVRVKTQVASVNLATGTLSAGGLSVDYTPHLSVDPTLAPSAGASVEVSGTQPARGGILVVSGSGDGISLTTVDPEAQTAGAVRR
jgi:hypothetical protein